MRELTSFQVKCKNQLFKELTLLGLSVNDIAMRESNDKWFAPKEVFIEASIIDGLKIWIYEDGAHILDTRDKELNFPFESQDYKTEEDLIYAFVEKVKMLIRNRDSRE